MATDSSNGTMLSGLPRWARVVTVVGAPTLFATWLLYFLTSTVGAQVQAINDGLQRHIAQTETHSREFSTFIREHSREEIMLRQIFVQICVNGSETKAERDACFPKDPEDE